MPPPDHERGAALLTVLMLVAVIAVIAAGALERLRLATRLAGNAAQIEQARGFAYAAETLALSRVDTLLGQSRDKVVDTGWSGRPYTLPLPGGTAVARVRDGSNCFNLNGLVSEVTPGVYAANPAARLQFARLLRLIAVPAATADQVAAGASDWIDSDADQQAGGAEDQAYLAQALPYRTAGTLMTDPSELRAVAGVTADLYARARPWLCTLPIAAPAKINVNTLAPEQAPLFAMLLPDTLSVAAAAQLLLRRPPEGYKDVSQFWAGPAQSGLVAAADAQGQTAVTSTWFRLDVDVALAGTTVTGRAIIDARRLPARVVTRQWGDDS